MANAPLLVPAIVMPDAFPIVEALRRLHRDIGSVAAHLVAREGEPPPPAGLRLFCVGCVDAADVDKLSRDLSAELRHDPIAARLASKVAVIEMDHGLCVVVFRDLACVSAEELLREDHGHA
jgi:hypothetical protein